MFFQFFLGIAFGILYSVASGLGLPAMVDNVFPILFGNAAESPAWIKNIADTFFDGKVDGGFLLVCCLFIPGVILIRLLALLEMAITWHMQDFQSYNQCKLICIKGPIPATIFF